MEYEFLKVNNAVLTTFAVASIGFGRVDNFLTESNWLNMTGALGLELKLYNQFYLRGGVTELENLWEGNVNAALFAPSVGIGYENNGLNIDYSWGDFYSKAIPLQKHVISASIQFKREKNKIHNDTTEPTRL